MISRTKLPRTKVQKILDTMDIQEFSDLLSFMPQDAMASIQRMVVHRAKRDPLFRDLIVSAGFDQAAYRNYAHYQDEELPL